MSIPIQLLNSPLSPLETVVYYLFKHLQLSKSTIASLLHRDPTTIWTTIDKARKKITDEKFGQLFLQIETEYLLPLSLLSKRKMSILEHSCLYLKEKYSLSNHNIALLLGKDDRTIWTVLHRATKKIK